MSIYAWYYFQLSILFYHSTCQFYANTILLWFYRLVLYFGPPLWLSWERIHLQSRRTGFDPLGWEDPLEKRKAPLSSSLARRIPSTVWSMGSQRVGHDWVTFTFTIFLNQKVWCHQLCFSLSRLLELFGIFSSSIQILEFFCVLFVKNWSFDRDYIEFVYCGGQYEYLKY